MKTYKIFLLLAMFSFASCESYLDYAPELETGEEDVFRNYRSVRGYLDNCYQALNNNYTVITAQGWKNANMAAMSDEGAFNSGEAYNMTFGQMKTFNTGDWYGRANLAEVGYNNAGLGGIQGKAISNAFYSIRITNKIIERVPKMDNLTQEEKDKLLGQAYFMRSWNYFKIIKRWGGMPIYEKAYASDEWKDEKRLTYQESTEWLIEGYNKAFELLPHQWSAEHTGRVTKVAALAAKSVATLYAASPLMQNAPGEPVQNTGYNKQWAERAAQNAHEALSYIWNQRPEKDMVGLNATTPEEKREAYEHIFYHEDFVGGEDLFYHNSAGLWREPKGSGGNPARVELARHFMNIRYSGRPGGFGQNFTSVTQNLVDKFEVINPDDGQAYPFGHSALGSTEEQWDEPYQNRDPRFYNNIFYTGDATHGHNNEGEPLYLENYPGGADYEDGEVGAVEGGYMCIKWWWPTANKWTGGWGDYFYNGVFIRTTQLYLDYAEAMNEAYGPNADPQGYGMTAVEAINKVRNRVGMVDVNPIYTGSAEKFRERIRNERAVELMWENKRWHDLRRWMTAHEVLGKANAIKGVRVEDLTPGVQDVGEKDFSYRVVDLPSEFRVFKMKHYWYPLPKDHMERLHNVEQNPGW